MTNKYLAKIIGGVIIAGALTLLPTKAKAELDGNIRGILSSKSRGSYIEINAFYKLGKDISGFTFLDYASNGDTYYGRTSLDKPIRGNVGIKCQIVHGSGFPNQAGIGMTCVIPKLPKNVFANVSFIPLWIDKEGFKQNLMRLGYFGEAKLKKNCYISGFGEWNVAAEGGIKWEYGEVSLGKKINPKLQIEYNPALMPDGDAMPSLEHRVAVQYNLK